ncbi:MAG: peptidylprolyl isomerase [Nitrospiraceae bacterium]
MARAQDPDSAGSQFFVVVEDSRFLDRKYTIFGEVVKGIGVADKIVAVPRVMCQGGAPNHPDKGPCDNPLDHVEMTVTIVGIARVPPASASDLRSGDHAMWSPEPLSGLGPRAFGATFAKLQRGNQNGEVLAQLG